MSVHRFVHRLLVQPHKGELACFPMYASRLSGFFPAGWICTNRCSSAREDLMLREMSGDDKLSPVELITILLAGLEREHPYL